MSVKAVVLLAIGAVLAVLLWSRFPFVNGWGRSIASWQRVEPVRLAASAALALFPAGAGLILYERRRCGAKAALHCLVASTFLLQLAVAFNQPPGAKPGARRIIAIVKSPGASGYFHEAERWLLGRGESELIGPTYGESAVAGTEGLRLRDWLDRYDQHLPALAIHPRTKPPGPTLLYAPLVALGGENGTDRAALLAGLLLAGLTCGSVLVTALMIRELTNDEPTAIFAAALLMLCPSLLLTFPMYDPTYVSLAAGLIALWMRALRTGCRGWALAYGLALTLTTFFSYVLLTLGAFLAAVAIAGVVAGRWPLRTLLRQSAIAIATVAVVYFGFWLLTGFDPIATFRVSLANQSEVLAWLNRPLSRFLAGDLYGLVIGLGWTPLLLGLFWLSAAIRARRWNWILAVVFIGYGQVLVVAFSGLVVAETARVWAFLLPLMILPAAMELRRWDPIARAAALLAALMILTATWANLEFVSAEAALLR